MSQESMIQQEAAWHQLTAQLAHTSGVIIDAGGGSPHQGVIKQSNLGADTRYVCIDLDPRGRPHIIGDVMRLPIVSNSIDAILCDAVLEHIPGPQEAVNEIYRTLKPGSQALIAVPFTYSYHDQIDFYRFSDDALRHLFRKFEAVKLYPLGNYAYVVLMFLTGFRFGLVKKLTWLASGLDKSLNVALSIGSGNGRHYLRSLSRTVIGWYVQVVK